MKTTPIVLRTVHRSSAVNPENSWLLAPNSLVELSAKKQPMVELDPLSETVNLELIKQQQTLQIWIDGKQLASITDFFNDQDATEGPEFFFTDSVHGRLSVDANAPLASSVVLWPMQNTQEDSAMLPLWLCGVALIGASSGLASSDDRGEVDRTPPVAARLFLSEDSGISAVDFVTNSGLIEVSLAADATGWQYSLDSGNSWLDGRGNTFELTENQRYEVGDIVIRQYDAAGNLSQPNSNPMVILIDTFAPTAPPLGLAADTGSSNSDRVTSDTTLNITLSSDSASWEYQLKDSGWLAGSGSSLELAANQTYAVGEIEVRQTDLAGNLSPINSNSAVIITDTLAAAAPTISLVSDTGSSDSDGITQNRALNIALASDTASWEYQLKESGWLIGTDTHLELADNTQYSVGEITVRQYDTAGNLSAVGGNSSTITIDNIAPSAATVESVALYSAVPAIDVADQFVRGTAALASGEQLNVVIGSDSFNNVTVTDGVWQINRDQLGELTNGSTISVSATITDLAGNQTADTSSDEITVQRTDIVIFDLTSGTSSFHGVNREFSDSIDYNIFIIVDSDGTDMTLASELQWHGWQNLGSGDTVWLVGDEQDADVMAYSSGSVTASNVTSSQLVWASQTPISVSSYWAFAISSAGQLSRAASSASATALLFTPSNSEERLSVSGAIGQGYLATINAGAWSNILFTQGLS